MNKTVNIIATVLTITTAQSVVADHIQYSPSETPYPLGQGVAALSNDCDKASAHPYDPMRTEFSGVKFSDINPDLAEKACKEWANVVIQKYKNKKPTTWQDKREVRAIYQMSRVISKQGDDAAALKYNELADDLGYPYASHYLYLAYENGWGTDKDAAKATLYLEKSLSQNIPAAFLARAELELQKTSPDFTQARNDLYQARKGGLPLMLPWARFHEKFGETILRSSGEILREDPACFVKECGDKISDLSERELTLSFPYDGLRNYQTELAAAVEFVEDYLMNHDDAFANKFHKRLSIQLDSVKRAAEFNFKMLTP
tara:strand:- start:8864 stop:9811 length:948 start_codon:yes stop_codon:yes gene_type:complete